MISTDLSLPMRAHIELTSRCNFKCITCKHGYISYGSDIDDNICDIIIKEILPNIEEVELQGTGESLLSHNFDRIFEAAQKNNCYIILITNGSMLNQQRIKQFVNSKMQIVFSLDGSDSSTFKKHRPVGDFDKISENIRNLHVLRDNTKPNSLSTVINMVLTKYNVNSIKNMIDYASKMGIDHLFVSEVRHCMPDDNQWDNLRLDNIPERETLISNIVSASQYAKEQHIGFTFNPYDKKHIIKKKICPSPWKHIFITAEGRVSFCCELNSYFGHLKNESFEKIWNGNKMIKFRNDMLIGNYHCKCTNCCLPWGITHE